MVLLLIGVAAIIEPAGSRRNTPQESSRGPAHALHHFRELRSRPHIGNE
jgi:hypothetical protein